MEKKKVTKIRSWNNDHFRVTIFGSSRIEHGDKIYEDVKKLAKMLGEQDIDVITGGGPGLMRAGNEGHTQGTNGRNSEALSIGIGVDLPWVQNFNDSVEYKEQFNRFSNRLDKFMTLSNAVVVAPGGLGTTLELFYTWQLAQVHHICNIPIILMGEMWEGLLKWVKESQLKNNYLDEQDYKLVFHVKNPEEAMKIIEEAHKSFKSGGKDFCLNYEKYKVE